MKKIVKLQLDFKDTSKTRQPISSPVTRKAVDSVDNFSKLLFGIPDDVQNQNSTMVLTVGFLFVIIAIIVLIVL